MIPATGFLSISNYDMDRSAMRFLVATPPEPANLNQQLTVLVNWPAQLNRR
jgi:hypothetical protein